MQWYNQRRWAVILGLISLLAAYSIGIHSLDTGSWQQYILTLLLLVLGLNRLFRFVWPYKESRHDSKH